MNEARIVTLVFMSYIVILFFINEKADVEQGSKVFTTLFLTFWLFVFVFSG